MPIEHLNDFNEAATTTWEGISYPELTDTENAEIVQARNTGYAAFFPAYPNADAQSRNTLAGARTFLAEQAEAE